MSRPLRIEYEGAWYHIMNRGRRKERIFFCDYDYMDFLKLLQQCKETYALEVHAYSLMSNHYHLLVRTPRANISRIMRHINGVYTQHINNRHKYDGSLFRGRYKSIIIGESSYLKKLFQYIHMNPISAKICKKPEDHKWTSHNIYLGKRKNNWIETEFLISLFGKQKKEAIRKLDVYVKTNAEGQDLFDKLDKRRWPAVLGGDAFKKKIRNFVSEEQISRKEIWQFKAVTENNITVKDIINVLIDKCGIKQEDIYKSRRGNNALGRRAFIYLCRRYAGKSCREIANLLNGISYKTISWHNSKAEKEVEKRRECYSIIKEVEKRLN